MAERNLDAAARIARERAELAAVTGDRELALEACIAHAKLYACGWRLFDLPAAGAPTAPKEITALYDGRCVECRAPIAAGDRIVYSDSGSRCLRCGKQVAA